ncbi:MAG: hypothetical protein HYZ55_01415, partial [Nitrosarchaeum sp.]|nr:hypothetical protein [Nitrosarchaeum sp.]
DRNLGILVSTFFQVFSGKPPFLDFRVSWLFQRLTVAKSLQSVPFRNKRSL